MDKPNAKKIADYVFKDIFGIDNLYSLEELQKKFAIDIPSVQKGYECFIKHRHLDDFIQRRKNCLSAINCRPIQERRMDEEKESFKFY